jgi:hypothetical protein
LSLDSDKLIEPFEGIERHRPTQAPVGRELNSPGDKNRMKQAKTIIIASSFNDYHNSETRCPRPWEVAVNKSLIDPRAIKRACALFSAYPYFPEDPVVNTGSFAHARRSVPSTLGSFPFSFKAQGMYIYLRPFVGPGHSSGHVHNIARTKATADNKVRPTIRPTPCCGQAGSLRESRWNFVTFLGRPTNFGRPGGSR